MEKVHNDLCILLLEMLAPVRLGWSLFLRMGQESHPCRFPPGVLLLLLLLLFSFLLLCPDLLFDALFQGIDCCKNCSFNVTCSLGIWMPLRMARSSRGNSYDSFRESHPCFLKWGLDTHGAGERAASWAPPQSCRIMIFGADQESVFKKLQGDFLSNVAT